MDVWDFMLTGLLIIAANVTVIQRVNINHEQVMDVLKEDSEYCENSEQPIMVLKL